jgi:hypothetical protein
MTTIEVTVGSTRMGVHPRGASSTATRAVVSAASSFIVTNTPHDPASTLPVSIPSDEVFFWTSEWLAGEAESRAALARGEGITFATADDAIRALLAP